MSRIDQELFEVGKVQPNDLELEEAVLGAIMLEKDSCHRALQLLRVDVFYKDAHQTIFKAISNVHNRKDPVDIMTVVAELKRLKQLDPVGGAYYITQLTNRVASAVNTEYHCMLLLQYYFKREMIRISTSALRKSYDAYTDVFEIQDATVQEVKNIGSFLQANYASDNNQTIDNVLADIKTAKNKGGILGRSFGIKNLDWVTSGLIRKCVYVIAALPGVGKSSLVKSIGVNLAYRQNCPGVFFSLEMPKEMLMRVCISEILQIPNDKFSEITAHDEERILNLKNTLFANNFIIVDSPGLSPSEIRSILVKIKEKHNIEWFAIDYLRLMRLKGRDAKGKNLDTVLSEITADLKTIAKELDLACIELAQMNKEGSKRSNPRPILTDIRDSGSIEANADVVILPYRPEKMGITVGDSEEDTGHTELIVAKNRFGPLKIVAAKFKHEYTQFVNNDEGVEIDVKYNPSSHNPTEESTGF